jgi:hypothetical protein
MSEQEKQKNHSADKKYAYLDYLEKEMAIMGILSAFSVAVVALFVQQIGTSKNDVLFGKVWQQAPWYILLGSAFVIVSAGFFLLPARGSGVALRADSKIDRPSDAKGIVTVH